MAQQNVTVQGAGQVVEGDEAEILINAGPKDLVITVKDYLTVGGVMTKNGNRTVATTHGNIMLPSGGNLSVNYWLRGNSATPRRNVTIK